MKYVILRDDDTNALTPVAYLERLYRPFLDHGLPVNLATIPNVRTDVTYGEGILEGFLVARNGVTQPLVPLGENQELVQYLRDNPGFKIAQHGYNHEFVQGNCEWEQRDRREIIRRIEDGARLLAEAGFGPSRAFVAPYDLFTPESMAETAARFPVISTGWFEWRRMPAGWWPWFFAKKLRRSHHWRVGNTVLLSHPGCHLSYHRPPGTILDRIRQSIEERPLTVLVTHWWEFFRDNQPNEPFIDVLHETAEYLRKRPDVQVVSFEDVAAGKVSWN
jgi:hypothetical protein